MKGTHAKHEKNTDEYIDFTFFSLKKANQCKVEYFYPKSSTRIILKT